MNTRSPTECPAWARLLAQAESTRTVHLRDLFASRKLVAEAAGCATTSRASAWTR